MFRAWFLVTKLGWVLFPVLGVVWWLGGPGWLIAALFGVLAGLGLTGAGMAIVSLVWGLRMGCPFCGRKSPVGGDPERGFWMRCEGCGVVEGCGRFSLGLKRELDGEPQS